MRTVFYQGVVEDCEADALHLAGMVVIGTDEDACAAVQELIRCHLQRGGCNYSVAYTAGHYGDLSYQWLFSHYEIYDPRDPSLPTMVILRYRPNFNP
jgi:hypothetical protein